jgi:hypothetical protein
MSLATHLSELNEKHKLLKRQIEDEMARPAVDEGAVRRLKTEKLRIKDQIAKLQKPSTH